MTEPLKKQILIIEPNFYEELDSNLKLFAREIKKELHAEGHVVIGITGYPGVGKSNAVAILGSLIDDNYDFETNVCYIPTSNQIEKQYYELKKYSFLHIDEASRGLHKHKWQDKIQQKLNQLYDTEREGHFLATALIMPRFQNFTENFRNFMIKYWIHIPTKGLALFYKKDEDKDTKDPWHIDENYKAKKARWRGKRVFERELPNIVRAEQVTDCYWFYCKIPAIPKDIWKQYQELKVKSRVEEKDSDIEIISYKEKVENERIYRWNQIKEMKARGYTNIQMAAILHLSPDTIRKNLKQIMAEQEIEGIKKGLEGDT